jgi:hypothetical protein
MAASGPSKATSTTTRRYLRAPVPLRFPESESVPETGVHLRLRTALWSMIRLSLGDRVVVGSDQFLYWDPTDPRQCLAPDVLVWVGGPDHPFPTWKVWERGAPHLAVEIISDDDTSEKVWGRKLDAYRRSGVQEVARFDPADTAHPLRLWDRVDGDLVERELLDRESFRCDCLQLYWLVEPSAELGLLLRLTRDRAGKDRLLTDAEARQAEAEARQAEVEARLLEAERSATRIRELEAELAKRR